MLITVTTVRAVGQLLYDIFFYGGWHVDVVPDVLLEFTFLSMHNNWSMIV